MSKIAKILILITSISLVLVMYVIISSKLVVMEKEVVNNNSTTELGNEKKTVDLEQLARDYKREIKIIMDDVDKLILNLSATSTAQNEVSSTSSETAVPENEIKATLLKTRAMDLIVPEQFKDLHIKIVLAISRFDEYSKTKVEADLQEGIVLVDEVKAESILTE
jgi:hypothetical protein